VRRQEQESSAANARVKFRKSATPICLVRLAPDPGRVEYSREFYRLLAGAIDNQVVCVIVDSLADMLIRFVRVRVAAGGQPQPLIRRNTGTVPQNP
jgi:DNA-binding FadR family transcriptional regulator